MPDSSSTFVVDLAAAFGGFLAARVAGGLLRSRFGISGLGADVGGGILIHVATKRWEELDDYAPMISLGGAIASVASIFQRCAPTEFATLIRPAKLGDYSDAHEPSQRAVRRV